MQLTVNKIIYEPRTFGCWNLEATVLITPPYLVTLTPVLYMCLSINLAKGTIAVTLIKSSVDVIHWNMFLTFFEHNEGTFVWTVSPSLLHLELLIQGQRFRSRQVLELRVLVIENQVQLGHFLPKLLVNDGFEVKLKAFVIMMYDWPPILPGWI